MHDIFLVLVIFLRISTDHTAGVFAAVKMSSSGLVIYLRHYFFKAFRESERKISFLWKYTFPWSLFEDYKPSRGILRDLQELQPSARSPEQLSPVFRKLEKTLVFTAPPM